MAYNVPRVREARKGLGERLRIAYLLLAEVATTTFIIPPTLQHRYNLMILEIHMHSK